MVGEGERMAMPAVTPGPLAPLAEAAAAALKNKAQTVAVFESTCGGLVQAALQAVPGASAFTTCGAVTYHSSKAVAVLGCDLSAPRPADASGYVAAKQKLTAAIARRMRDETGADWCVSESGACGPSFNVPGISLGFTVITVSHRDIERSVIVESTHARREDNMWGFAKAALDLLEQCLQSVAAKATMPTPAAEAQHFSAKEDRYGGVEVEVLPTVAHLGALSFQRALNDSIEKWVAAGKRGLWLRVPLVCAHFLGAARDERFQFHHAKPDYVQLTRWLPENVPSPLPLYAFTQIGVGGVVVNRGGQVLMVQERVSPLPMFQNRSPSPVRGVKVLCKEAGDGIERLGVEYRVKQKLTARGIDSWKLPGGLADPGEDFADTVAREVREETGVVATLVGVVSMRHSHGFRFGQGDIYVLVKLLASNDEIQIDHHELQDARWMSPDTIRSLVASGEESLDGKVSENNFRMIDNALNGSLILGQGLPNSRGPRPTMLYTAPSLPPSAL